MCVPSSSEGKGCRSCLLNEMHSYHIKRACWCTGGGSLLREGEAALLDEASEVGLA